MKVKCPNCQVELETEVELAEGQHVLCPECGRKFEFFHARSRVLDTGDENGGCCVRHRPWMTVVTGLLVSFIIVMFVADAFWGILDEDLAKNVTEADLRDIACAVVKDDKGNPNLKFIIVKPRIRSDVFKNQATESAGIIIDAEKRVCHVNEYADDGNRVNRFLNGDSGYSLQNDSEWRACCEEIELILKGRSAKAVIRYLGKYR